ncbi:ATP-binding protein [Streptomyces sp. NPDC006296]|uniref:ATP-binding protein n=1 Tax=Streptomyces sp. NPDC006296 TaxID=3156746 RepID=UPI0033B7855E
MTPTAPDGIVHLATIALATEQDVRTLRRGAEAAAAALGAEGPDRTRLATALGGLGPALPGSLDLRVALSTVQGPCPVLRAALLWADGPGPDEGFVQAASGLVRVHHEDGSRTLLMEQRLTAEAQSAERVQRARDLLVRHIGGHVIEDDRARTVDLIAALEESRAQREELHRLNEELEATNRGVVALYTQLSEELEETNRGVVALYAELDEKSHQLRRASEAKTRFWAHVSHELRTPVNSVVGLARLLLDAGSGGLDEEQRRQVSLISASGATLLALVDELLDVAKAESGRLEPHPSAVDLRALLGQLRGTLKGYGTRGEVDLSVATSGLPLVTDEVMLTRILRNLLSNALKFTERGTVRLDVAADGGPGDEQVVFTVTDTGVGIPEEEQQQIFEEFYQVRGPHQRGRPGTGLGLPYARRLTELLGGTLTLTSRPGAGTRVVVRLPAGTTAAPGGERPPALARLVTVDDDAAFRSTVRPVLARLAQQVSEVGEGARAIDTVRTERPDAVLLDLHMPDVDGYQVLAGLADDPELRGTPVVVVTSAPVASLDSARLTHARAVLDKSTLDLARLLAVLEDLDRPRTAGEDTGR